MIHIKMNFRAVALLTLCCFKMIQKEVNNALRGKKHYSIENHAEWKKKIRKTKNEQRWIMNESVAKKGKKNYDVMDFRHSDECGGDDDDDGMMIIAVRGKFFFSRIFFFYQWLTFVDFVAAE